MKDVAQPTTVYPRGEDFLLLPPTQQAFAYRNVDRMFATRTIRRGSHVYALDRGPELDVRYLVDEQTFGLKEYVARSNIAGLLVIKDGRIVVERYSLGLQEETRWSSMSMIKSFTSTLVGAALKDGAIDDLDDPVAKYVSSLRSSAYDRVRVKDLLTMASGVEWNEDYADRRSHVNIYSKSLGDGVPGGVLRLMKSLKEGSEPGSTFRYNTGDTYVLGALVSAAVSMPLAEYMSRKIWSPFGMEFDAFYTLESPDGQEIGGSRAGITLRDFGRFGLFVLGGGIAGGENVLPDFWVEAANHASFELAPEDNAHGAVGYGFNWWIDRDGAMVAVGFAGQSLYINRRSGVVIVTLACQPQPPHANVDAFDFKRERLHFKEAVLHGGRFG